MQVWGQSIVLMRNKHIALWEKKLVQIDSCGQTQDQCIDELLLDVNSDLSFDTNLA